jgi:N-sulfoglucosamine sulfohydrolase
MKYCCLLIALVLGFSSSVFAQPATTQPNILWISSEDLSPDLHCYGDDYSITPNLDRFAAQGARFTRAFSTAPVCSPSRCSIITGMYASTVGGHHHRSKIELPPNVKCFTEYLRQAGYFCTNNVKTDYNFPPPRTAWDQNGRNAHWRNRPDKSKPFFAVFNFTTTHESHAMSLEGAGDSDIAQLSPNERHDPAKAKLAAYYPDTPIVRATWARYYDLITAMDKQFQEILDQLEKDGLADNTIVFFWGDHGRCLPRGKRWAYDSGLRVPLIVRWPGKIDAGSVREDLVTLMDLGPTLISITGQDVPSQMQGRVILGPKAQPAPQYVFATRDRMDETFDMQRSVRDQRYRYIKNFHPELPYSQPVQYMDMSPIMKEWRRLASDDKLTGAPALFFAKTKPPEELYDLEADPDEVKNLAASPEHQERLGRMRAALDQWQKETDDLGLKPENPAQKVRPKRRPANVE